MTLQDFAGLVGVALGHNNANQTITIPLTLARDIKRVLGDVDASPELDVFEVPVAPGERWLFCSDGLTDVVSPEKIHEVLRDSEALNQAVDTLVDLTLKGGAPDNVTVVAFEIAEGTAEELAPVPDVHLSEQAL
ncbi:hypothetical protein SOP60_12650, partial [Staphylococcus haemolyticus]|nr:hypothetical protein [Staphylococcus haemolyticus]